MTDADRCSASASRVDEEADWIVRQFIRSADLRLAPEEYVAQHAHLLGGFSFHLYRFRDPVLGNWVRRVGELLDSKEEVTRCREQYLSTDELAIAREQDNEQL